MFDDIKVTNEGIITLDAYAKFKINVIIIKSKFNHANKDLMKIAIVCYPTFGGSGVVGKLNLLELC
jgi:hypothetical protein